MTHWIERLDDVVHQRVRLGILTVLDVAGEVDFGSLQEQLDASAGNLSRHLQVLEEAGYVDIRKGFHGRRPRTWARLTEPGKHALAEEVEVLRTMLEQHDDNGRR